MGEFIISAKWITLLSGATLLSLLGIIWLRRRSWKRNLRTLSSITRAAAIPGYRNSFPQLNREISRVRRYQHPLAVIVVRPIHAHGGNHSPHAIANDAGMSENGSAAHSPRELSQIEFLLCGSIFRDSLREVDITTYDAANNQFVIMLPESTRFNAEKTINRLRAIIEERISNQLFFGISEFPEDGLILEDLVEQAVAQSEKRGKGDNPALQKSPQNIKTKK
ncbi:MAG: hypothetical protein L6Q94_12320 [Calditrichia bacterium]|nr:hypothetical protein [Calditrichia bacterium]